MMSNVTYKKLGEVANIYQPKTLSTAQLKEDGKYLVYGANGVIGRYDEYNHTEKELLVTCRGATCGTINVSEPYSWINGNAMVVHITDAQLQFDFLKYVLSQLDWTNIITGAAQPQITRQKLAPAVIPVPSLEDQQRIVRELDAIHAILTAKNEQLRELDNLAQAIFYDMFGDPTENEKGWNIMTIRDVFPFIKNGANIKQSKDADGLPITRIETLSGGRFNRDRLGYANIYDTGKYASYYLETGDILMSHINGKAYIGRAVMYVKEGAETIIHGMNLLRLKANRDIIDPCYATFYFKTEDFKAKIVSIRKDAVNQSSFSVGDLSKLSLPLPPLDLQQAFASKISAIEQQKERIRFSLSETETLLAARMQHYFD